MSRRAKVLRKEEAAAGAAVAGAGTGHPVQPPAADVFVPAVGLPVDRVFWDRGPSPRAIWDRADVQRRKKWRGYVLGNQGMGHFFQSAEAFEWTFFVIMLLVFFYIQWHLKDWPGRHERGGPALLVWLIAAGFFNFIVCGRLGAEAGGQWMAGYALELIFSMENLFIYHIVVEAFGMPDRQCVKALLIVISFQMVFQMVFFMGLADVLNGIWVLPYFLGAWLIYVGYGTLHEDDEHQFVPEDSSVFRALRACFGDRLSRNFDKDCSIFFTEDGLAKVSLLGPATLCLLVVDFVMEIDVTLTKIEEIPNHYIAFTSSVAATFAVPELYFVARGLFRRYHLLKYGISFVLFLFGFELLLTQIIVVYEMVNVLLILAVMLLCIGASSWMGYTAPDEAKSVQAGAESVVREVAVKRPS